jgi:AcrR family transcriptional regulator
MTQETDSKNLKQEIIEKYQEFLLLEGKSPASVYAFCKDLEISEAEFYQHFSDFDQIAAHFWLSILEATQERLQSSPEWESFSAREKLLSFYYGFFESLKGHRSYALLILKSVNMASPRGAEELKELKSGYKDMVKELVAEGQQNNEIASRSKLNDIYDDLFWMQFLFLLDYWRKDRSAGFERSDEAIEKSVNLSFDLIEKNALDSAFDFGKFMFQNR